MANRDRLSGLDSSFLHLERDATHMHVGACAIFAGEAPAYRDFVEEIDTRLHLVPRYRQRLAFVPFSQGRPVWVDDPHFQITYHVRHTALPRPGDERQLERLAGRVFSQALDRSRPLWELWLVEGLAGDRFALLSKTHHSLVDGVSGVDIASVMFDTAPDPAPVAPPSSPWIPRPLPPDAQLLADALVERATVPAEVLRGVRRAVRGPRQVAGKLGQALAGLGAMTWAGLQPAPPSPFNVSIGPHRRFTWVQADLSEFKAIKNSLGGTVNDVVLAVVAGALGRYMRLHSQPTEDVVLKAMVPVSVRADAERGALGNRVAAMWAPLPVGLEDPAERLTEISGAMAGIKDSGQAVGAQVLTGLTGFAPPTIMAQAARLQARQRLFNLVVTNVPGPQLPLYVLGRELQALYPMVPLAQNTALGIAIMSYNGTMNFGLNGDYDALSDIESLADELRAAIEELAAAAQGSGDPPPDPVARRRQLRAVN
ncbi:MAG TPA: wax ester/triacylglycerol synthase family O-acyltransferase [Solirubrobacteraceae bacterium]|jgi:WS/DGAT/MGAT family acyltransferase|nr:wax ester/triacylglycerol synthase family O-acyltransferase [Solirubrobacteraceae bacterium]